MCPFYSFQFDYSKGMEDDEVLDCDKGVETDWSKLYIDDDGHDDRIVKVIERMALVLFYETDATHAFTHLLITFTRVYFFG